MQQQVQQVQSICVCADHSAYSSNNNTAPGGDYFVGGWFLAVELVSTACDWLPTAILLRYMAACERRWRLDLKPSSLSYIYLWFIQ